MRSILSLAFVSLAVAADFTKRSNYRSLVGPLSNLTPRSLPRITGNFTRPAAHLSKRQTTSGCDIGEDECGQVCIDSTDTCCPDGLGGCPVGTYCGLADNGVYGCCEDGETCTGDAGDPTIDEDSGGAGCGIGQEECGTTCISVTSFCCPDLQGGCGVGEECTTDDNGEPACCPAFETCDGGGGGISNVGTFSSAPNPTSSRTRTATSGPTGDASDSTPSSNSGDSSGRPFPSSGNPAPTGSFETSAGNFNTSPKNYVALLGTLLGAGLGLVLML